MFSAATKSAHGPATEVNYIESVFSTYLFTGNGATQTINNGINLDANTEASYTTPGTYSWTCPAGVTSISVVCVGGGANATSVTIGGGGGELRYKNNISVTPGTNYTIVVGAAGAASTFNSTIVVANGGSGATGGSGGTGDGGGNGGAANATTGGGGGGAGGYSGTGGSGGAQGSSGTAGAGGAGGGGGGAYDDGLVGFKGGGGGGGVGLLGSGSNGAGGSRTFGGGGGSGGATGASGTYGSGGTNGNGGDGGLYGGGGGGRKGTGTLGLGVSGAVRIIYPGSTRQFPSTSTGFLSSIVNNGMVWIKSRSAATNHFLFDTTRGALNELNSNTTDAQASLANSLTAFNANGFSLGSAAGINTNAETYASWTFRKAPKFFDVVTYTGDGANRTIAHSLGSVPGMIIVKRTDTTGDWQVYHRSLANTEYLVLNTTAAKATGATRWNSTTPTSSVFSVGTDASVNASGGTYVAYIFAHNAGGFGLTGTDNVISCGTFTAGTGSFNLGYEPQWIMFKGSTGVGGWIMFDTMRGWPTEAPNKLLMAQSTAAESDTFVDCQPTATGFNYNFSPSCIYMAIRRPMKPPTSGTEVFTPVFGINATPSFISNSTVDMIIQKKTTGYPTYNASRLAGQRYLTMSNTDAEGADTTEVWDYQKGQGQSVYNGYIGWALTRRPGFFDVVCYTGTGSARTVTHNLGVAPEMMIVKSRSAAGSSWLVYEATLGNTQYLAVNTTAAVATLSTIWNNTTPTSSVFTLGTNANVNQSTTTYVAYLFASVAGVSKVGSYTGTGAAQTINCGFTGGARFVMIKKTSAAGDWYVYDTARGMTTLTDPYLLLNSTATETATLGSVTTTTGGFTVNAAILAAINTSGASYIFYAVA